MGDNALVASMLGFRIWRVVAAVGVLLSSVPLRAAEVPPLDLVFDRVLYGDFSLVGNTVTACPPGEPRCLDARNRKGRGISAQNNGHTMGWADVDDDPATYNSSTSQFTVPPGARVVHATLTWAGNGAQPDRPCGGSAVTPAGTPDAQAVSFRVNAAPVVTVAPERFGIDSTPDSTDERFYSARADVTARLADVSGPIAVTVGNVWTPQGRDCFGGWSLTAVWAFDGPAAPSALAPRRVQVHDGQTRVRTDDSPVTVRASVKSAGGSTRVGVVAYEGDWAAGGDRLLVNGKPLDDNFFMSAADGAAAPKHLNNMSVDARTLEVDEDTIRAGATGADLTFSGGRADAYLVRGVAVSSPLPELQLDLTGPSAAHPGDQVAHTARITNVGAVPAADTRLRGDHACARDVGTVGAGQTITVQCPVTAPEDDYGLTATVTGNSLSGDQLAARASSSVDVLHPAIGVQRSAVPDTVLTGQTVRYAITVRNNGDTTLSTVSIEDEQVAECRRGDLGTLTPGQQVVVDCAGGAPDENFTAKATAAGADVLGKRVAAQGQVNVVVLHPRQEAAVPPSPSPPPPSPPVRPAASRSQLPVPTPVIVLGLATVAALLTVSAVARPKR